MIALERLIVSKDWITALIVLTLVLLVLAKNIYGQRLGQFLLLFATDKYLLLKGKDPNLFHPFNMLLFTVNVISASLFILLLFQKLVPDFPRPPEIVYLRIATAYSGFILIKFSIEKIVANILSLDKEINYYLFYKLTYRNLLALVLLPVCICFIYIWSPSLVILYVFLGLVLSFNLFAHIGLYIKNRQYILNHVFYFILYLCALEIGPYYILYKLITRL